MDLNFQWLWGYKPGGGDVIYTKRYLRTSGNVYFLTSNNEKIEVLA